jgi:hypothetical protein
MNSDRILVALLFVLVLCVVLEWNEEPSPAFAGILARLRHECDPANPESDYSWFQRSMPTERKRAVILADARTIGAKLLPELRRELTLERDAEVRGMLWVMAADLGDEAAMVQAGQELEWSWFPAVRIAAARTLRRLRDRRAIGCLLQALQDEHFVVNGGCGTLREKYYPVRVLAELALQEVMTTVTLSKAEVQRIREGLWGRKYEPEVRRKLESLMLEAERRGRL